MKIPLKNTDLIIVETGICCSTKKQFLKEMMKILHPGKEIITFEMDNNILNESMGMSNSLLTTQEFFNEHFNQIRKNNLKNNFIICPYMKEYEKKKKKYKEKHLNTTL